MMQPENQQLEVVCSCVIESLFKKSFVSRSFEEKLKLIHNGKPTPKLNLVTQIKNCKRYFSPDFYRTTEWLTGCVATSKLYCWPCLLFNKEYTVWNRQGFSDLNNLSKAIKRHGTQSNSHLCSILEFKKFGSQRRIEDTLDTSRKLSIQQHNAKVKHNRELLKNLIDVVCFLSMQELAFRGHNETETSLNKGNYIELLHLLSEHNPFLKSHLDSATIFKGISPDIQNALISSVSAVIKKYIFMEVEKASYISLILDESTDITTKSQLCTVLRFIDQNGDIFERFISFVDVSEARTASDLAEYVLNFVNMNKLNSKIISQSYDGAPVMASEINGLQAKVRQSFPNAIFIYCFAHKLNIILTHSCKKIKACQSFFGDLSAMVSFFSHSSKRMAALDKLIAKRLPKAAPTRWKYNGTLVSVILEYKNQLIELFSLILDDEDNMWDGNTKNSARGFLSLLSNGKFLILLNLFNKIFPETDILYNIYQTKSHDITYCISKTNSFVEHLEICKTQFTEFWKFILENVEIENITGRRGNNLSIEDQYKNLYFEIFTNVIIEIKTRFEGLNKFKFFGLMQCDRFKEFSMIFPMEYFENLKETYSDLFDFPTLKSELTVMYRDTDVQNSSNLRELLQFLIDKDLEKTFVGFSNLCKLIYTIAPTRATHRIKI